MNQEKEIEKKKKHISDGSEKIRPDSDKDFPGTEKAEHSKFRPATEETNEWEAREDENPTSH